MSIFKYILPWEAIPNMVKDVKKASSMEGKGKHDSIFGAIGRYADPAGALMGSKWQDFFHGTIPREVNRAMRPVNEFHMKYLDPLAMSGVTPQSMRDVATYKGGDLAAGVLGATAAGMFAAPALAGGGGSGGAAGLTAGTGTSGIPLDSAAAWNSFGGGLGGSFSGGSSASGMGGLGLGGIDWTSPSTYMKLAGNLPKQQQGPSLAQQMQQQMMEQERLRRERQQQIQTQAAQAQIQRLGLGQGRWA